jgi:hypothetical protein
MFELMFVLISEFLLLKYAELLSSKEAMLDNLKKHFVTSLLPAAEKLIITILQNFFSFPCLCTR